MIRDRLSALSNRTEFLIVFFGAFGLSLFSTAIYVFGLRPGPTISEQHLRSLLIYEAATLLVLCGFLGIRGWTLRRVGLTPRLSDALVSVALAVGAYVGYLALWLLAVAAGLRPGYLHGATSLVDGQFGLLTVVTVSIVNPLFEELFVCGYVIAFAQERGHPALGLNASVAIRLAYHLYQGAIGVLGIIPFGLVFGVWYSRTRRLFPVVVAHAFTDFVALVSYTH
jgi:membrane protease YdiL (CAAX protease family)